MHVCVCVCVGGGGQWEEEGRAKGGKEGGWFREMVISLLLGFRVN
jgi:hypothetical protein